MATRMFLLMAVTIGCFGAISAICQNGARCSNDLPCCATQANFSRLCCPYVDGKCCSDKFHCCPKNMECVDDKNHCIGKTRFGIPDIWNLQSPVPLIPQGLNHTVRAEVCPSKRSSCSSKSTCCPRPYVGYDCCPLSRGVCCGDFLSCCPMDHTCDLDQGECVSAKGERVPLYRKLKANRSRGMRVKVTPMPKPADHSTNVTCHGRTALRQPTCEANHKCCPAGCCPLANGVCCRDARTCCPSATVCDITKQTCTAITGPYASQPAVALVKDVISHPQWPFVARNGQSYRHPVGIPPPYPQKPCPGGEYTCPTHFTCCLFGNYGKYGCCPYPRANCCSDNRHCCPEGATCNLARDLCVRGKKTMPLLKKLDAIRVLEKKSTPTTEWVNATTPPNQNCPDQSTCPDTYTCCKMPNTKYGCCPLTSAVCCDDHIHCCPHGTICDLAVGGCRQGNAIDLEIFKNIEGRTKSQQLI